MATQSKTTPVTETIDAATERVVELNEKAVANGKKAGAAALETYEKAVVSFTESYEKAAGATAVDERLVDLEQRPSLPHREPRIRADGGFDRRPALLVRPLPRPAAALL